MGSSSDFDHEAAFNQERQRGADLEILEEIGYRWPPLTERTIHQVVAKQTELVLITPSRSLKERPPSRRPRDMEIRDRRPDLQPFVAGTADIEDLTGIAELGLAGVRKRNAAREAHRREAA